MSTINSLEAPRSIPHLPYLFQNYLIDVMSKRQKRIYLFLVAIWLCSLCYFWWWWLQSHHVVTIMGMAINTLLIAWNTILPGYYFYFVSKMKRPNPNIPIPDYWRVAIVVTKAPSEPWEIVKKTLEAMIAQDYPHDNWLADEDPQPETIEWCQQNGVFISSRKGIKEYHRATWPKRTRCKEGNLAYFYDIYGYDLYDFVAQLDADHVPQPGYLEAMIRPFIMPEVGYVAAPSICDANSQESWVVNARLFAEASMHGSLQAGYNDGWAPLCIGSHYAVRTAAVKDIGGLGPELAEDHTTTMMMNAHGWQGVFASDAEAHGDGPACFADFLVQEYQWSRSLTAVLLSITPRYWKGLSPHLKFQFLFSQIWYPTFALTILIGVLLPVLALINDKPWADVNYIEFLCRYFLLTITCVIPVAWIGRNGWFRPHYAPVMSWQTFLFQFARWPWILAGVCNAFISWVMRKELPFRVTPKGANAPKPLPFKILYPYLIISIVSASCVILLGQVSNAQGYYFLSLLNSLVYVGISCSIVWLHIRETYRPRYMIPKIAVFIAAILAAFASGLRIDEGVKTIVEDDSSLTIIESMKIDKKLKSRQ
jgi:cellulose synthase (UDP-forming)